jgi:hypothetical protein
MLQTHARAAAAARDFYNHMDDYPRFKLDHGHNIVRVDGEKGIEIRFRHDDPRLAYYLAGTRWDAIVECTQLPQKNREFLRTRLEPGGVYREFREPHG